MDPTNQNKVKARLSCLTCHQPHASAQPDLLVNDMANSTAFCDLCHKNRLNMNETTEPAPAASPKK
jgi:predicted CXXCH cytochrome family protein